MHLKHFFCGLASNIPFFYFLFFNFFAFTDHAHFSIFLNLLFGFFYPFLQACLRPKKDQELLDPVVYKYKVSVRPFPKTGHVFCSVGLFVPSLCLVTSHWENKDFVPGQFYRSGPNALLHLAKSRCGYLLLSGIAFFVKSN